MAEPTFDLSARAVTSRSRLEKVLRPRSIAIVGASATPGSLGESVLSNLERARFGGDLYLINPKRSEVRGRSCLSSIDELPDGVDCAVLAIPRAAVIDAVTSCARRGIGGLIIFSAGFAEAGPQGRKDQETLAQIASRHDMIIEGPNCLGMVNAVDGIPLTFVLTPPEKLDAKKGVAILSQSGALTAVLGVSLRSHGIGISFSISTGNEAVTGVEDYLEYLIADESTQVIALVVELFRKPRTFLALVRRARERGKHIVLLHPGHSTAARASAATHTGAIVGNYHVMRAKVAHAGVVLVDSMEELIDVTQILVRCRSVPKGGAAVLMESGAFKALTLDFCEAVALPLPELNPETVSRLREVLPDFIHPSNPLDVTAQALVDPDLYGRTMAPLLDDPQYGSLVLAIILTDETTSDLKLRPITQALHGIRPSKPVILAALDEGARFSSDHIEKLRTLGVPFFPSPERAFRALARLTESDARNREEEQSSPRPAIELNLSSGVVPEYKSKQMLAAAGVPVPQGELAATLEDAQRIASEIGFPLALKAQSSELSHKSDAGAVLLNVSNAEELTSAWTRLHHNVASAKPDLTLDGVLVERMSAKGVELIVGARNDAEWGPILMIGFGGVLAEAVRDVRLIPPGLSISAIEQELHQLKSSVLFRNFRGAPAADVRAAAEIVQLLGNLLQISPAVREIDINPLLVYPEGQGAIALDALIVTGPVV